MNLVPQVETAEISDADLDNVSGGLAVSAGVDAGVAVTATAGVGVYAEAGPLGICAGAGASVTPAGVAADAHAHTATY